MKAKEVVGLYTSFTATLMCLAPNLAIDFELIVSVLNKEEVELQTFAQDAILLQEYM